MKGSFFWKLMLLFCALVGCLTGYGIFRLARTEELKPNTNTKDNTLVRNREDSVFFNESPVPTTIPGAAATENMELQEKAEEEKITGVPVNIPAENQPESPAPTLPPVPTPVPENDAEDKPVTGQAMVTATPEITKIPLDLSGALSTAGMNPGAITPVPTPTPAPTAMPTPVPATAYPAEIFGQVPVVNWSDNYVTYFEFAWELVEVIRPEIKRRGLNETALIAEFVVKALFCGVDVQKYNINNPISRIEAAMMLWLAAQVMDEAGTNTSAKSASAYVTDIKKCSNSEKKAAAYLYERGIVSGYKVAGQQFNPGSSLKTEDGINWLAGAKQCWK